MRVYETSSCGSGGWEEVTRDIWMMLCIIISRGAYLCTFFIFNDTVTHGDLHSFPTRRSSDLEEAGMDRIGAKRDLMTAFTEFVIEDISEKNKEKCTFELITPKDKTQRGAQLSIQAKGQGKALFNALSDMGVVADWREPNVIRIAPAPLYNSYEDCYWFGQLLEQAIQ